MGSGEFKPLDPEIATWSLLGMMFPYFYPSHAGEALADETIRQIQAVYLNGIVR